MLSIVIAIFNTYLMYLDIFNFSDMIPHIKPEDKDLGEIAKNPNIQLEGKIEVSKEAGAEIAKGISNLGSNLGKAAAIGAVAGAVAKVLVKSPLPPVQKAGLVMAGGTVGAGLHVGISAVNDQSSIAGKIAIERAKEEAIKVERVNELAKMKADLSANMAAAKAQSAADIEQ